MLSQERKASSRIGRKRSNQAAELSDVSIEDETKDDSMMYPPGPRNRVEYDRGAETDSERQVRRISCTGRKRCSAKGVRLLNHDHTTTTAAKAEAFNAKPPFDKIIASSVPRCKTQRTPSVTTAATLHCSEFKDPLESASTELGTTTDEVPMDTPVNTDDQAPVQQVSGAATMDWHLQARDEDAGREDVSGMPDWAAELDEVVPGVKVVSIKDLLWYQWLSFKKTCNPQELFILKPKQVQI
ncbi:hypothetical protein QFC20_000915 [Naganishia adeliensis]|uniref:Uncharacterized protein n=1 Tax=Naganishia adeliensis TaxID=92952 RepID=A0ACC2WWR0_9TREE|nr:hypothetical protein QFC20_000915 [Naganishia adeliensis]